MPAPIWKDYTVSFGNVAEADYTIEAGGVTIYSGHAVRRPDESQLNVRINAVCADYLAHALPSISDQGCTADPCAVTFTVKDDGGNTVDTVQFVADWSYDPFHSVSRLSCPVNGRVSAAQVLVASVLTNSAVSVQLTFRSGGTQTLSVAAAAGDVQAVAVPLAQYADLAGVTVGGNIYEVVPACDRFALLYVNAFGGWDTLLMEGRSGEADAYDRRTMAQRYDNAVRSERGTVEYVNGVSRRWTLRTGWLTDAQAALMHHVLGSPLVYLYDTVDGVLLPVTITDEICEYKTYKGNGARMSNYTVSVELSQNMTRR